MGKIESFAVFVCILSVANAPALSWSQALREGLVPVRIPDFSPVWLSNSLERRAERAILAESMSDNL